MLVNTKNVQGLVIWCNNSSQMFNDKLEFQVTFIPYLVYLLSSVDSVFATDFLFRYIKRNNSRNITLFNLVISKFEYIVGLDNYFALKCIINEFDMLSDNVDGYHFRDCHIKKLIVDVVWDTKEIVDHFKALGNTIDEIIKV